MRGVHVSIHDVSPAFASEVDDALAACAVAGARPALLVVPNFHGKWPLDRYPAFAQKLQRLQADGHEIFLHGYYHLAGVDSKTSESKGLGGLRRAFAQHVVSAGEAEFFDVNEDEARVRIDRGEQMFERLGLRIDGFVAPAWSMASFVLPALAARGVRYTEDHLRVYDPVSGRSRVSLVLNFASRTRVRLWSSVGFVRVAQPAARLLPTRIAVHPGDMRSPLLQREVDRVLRSARGRFTERATSLLA